MARWHQRRWRSIVIEIIGDAAIFGVLMVFGAKVSSMRQTEEFRGIVSQRKASISLNWRRRTSLTLHKSMAEGILARAGRLNSGTPVPNP